MPVMWNVLDANASDGDDTLWSQYVFDIAPKPCVGETFTMMKDHRGPYEDREVIMVSGSVKGVDTTVFPKGADVEVHVSIFLDIDEMNIWDAAEEKAVAVLEKESS